MSITLAPGPVIAHNSIRPESGQIAHAELQDKNPPVSIDKTAAPSRAGAGRPQTVINSDAENTRAAIGSEGMIQPVGAVAGKGGGVGFCLGSFTAQHGSQRLASGQRVGPDRFARIAPVLGVAFQNRDMRSRLIRRGAQPARPPIRRTRRRPGAKGDQPLPGLFPNDVSMASKTARPFAPAAATSSKTITAACAP